MRRYAESFVERPSWPIGMPRHLLGRWAVNWRFYRWATLTQSGSVTVLTPTARMHCRKKANEKVPRFILFERTFGLSSIPRPSRARDNSL